MAKDAATSFPGAGATQADPLTFALAPLGDALTDARARWASLLLLDTLGVYIAAMPMEAGRIARDVAPRLYAANDARDQASLPLDGRRCSRAGAAFAMATQIDNLDAHDGYNPTKGHIGCAAVPALLAEAEGRELSGRDALAALIVAYEVAGRAGIALHATVSDYHTSGAWNGLGVAALGARMRRLAPEQLRHAFGIAEYHGPRSQMMREIAHPTMLHDGSGMG
ncbi:MAG: MmgE/PrpD family protein, partial [Pseudomonadota bacterium]